MPEISVVTFKRVEKEFRFDAEYYRPTFIEVEGLISNVPTTPLGRLLIDIKTSAFYGSISFYYKKEGGIPFIRVSDIEEPFLIAQGIPYDPGEPDEVAYFFDTKPMRTGRKNEDGSIDWKDRGDIPQVGEGELLAEIKPGSEGNYGIDIFGKKILPPSQNRVRLKKK